MLQSQILTTRKNKYIARKVIIFWQIYVASDGGYTLPYKRLLKLFPVKLKKKISSFFLLTTQSLLNKYYQRGNCEVHSEMFGSTMVDVKSIMRILVPLWRLHI